MANTRDVGSPKGVLGLLGTPEGERQACDVVSAWAQEGRFADLVGLARTLEAEVDRNDTTKLESYEVVADHVEDQLALTTGDEAVEALFALALESRERSVTVPRSQDLRVRAFGSRLGYGQTTQVFLAALERHGESAAHRELLACWMQEVVLRGTSLEHSTRAKKLRDVLLQAKHPLGGLPLVLLETEHEVPSYMPLYGDKGLGRAIDALTSGVISIRSIPPPADGGPVAIKVVEDRVLAGRLAAAVAPWGEGKNGKIEAKVFTLSRNLQASNLGRVFLNSLELESLAGASRVDVSRTTAEGVFGPLFSAASNGGAYSSGVGGAYGRLAAWTSFGALVGAKADADAPTIHSLASRSAFLVFRAQGPWFHDVAWDLGVVALRPDGLSAAVVAATDNE